jgi:hypothetical protein
MPCIATQPLPQPCSPDPLRKCFISVLPDELRLEIFSYVPLEHKSWKISKNEGVFPLMLVCRAWRHLYQSIFFRDIHLEYSSPQNKAKRIYNLLSIQEVRPHLRNYPQNIWLGLDETWSSKYRNICRILGQCRMVRSLYLTTRIPRNSRSLLQSATNLPLPDDLQISERSSILSISSSLDSCKAVRTLSLHTDFSKYSWPLLQSIKSMPLLKHLSLSGGHTGPSIYLLLEFFNLSTLRRLIARRHGRGAAPRDPGTLQQTDPTEREIPSITQQELERHLPPGRHHTVTVTSLELSYPLTPANVTEHILRWPKRLEELSLQILSHRWGVQYYDVKAVQQILNIHCQSLKKINLGIITGRSKPMPSFSEFPCLEDLRMCACNILSETPSTVLDKLATPSLRFLILDFDTKDGHDESVQSFGRDGANWIKEFAALKTAKYPKSRLEKISFEFNAVENPHTAYAMYCPECAAWPWQYLEQAKKAVSQHGLVLKYKTEWSREGWEEARWERVGKWEWREEKKRGEGLWTLDSLHGELNKLFLDESMDISFNFE